MVPNDRGHNWHGRKIHVLHVVDSLRVGGLENGVVNMINGLDRGTFRSSICCLKTTGGLQNRLSDPAVKVFELHQKPGDYLFPRLRKILRDEQVSILHSRSWGPFFDSVVAGRLATTPFIVHSIHGIYSPDIYGMRWKRRVLQRLLSLGTHKLYAVADYLRQYYIRVVGVPAKKIDTIYNGVDTEIYKATGQRGCGQERKKLGLPATDILIGSVGTLYWVKDPQTFLTAAAMVLQNRDDVSFLWVGGGPLKEDLQARAKELGIDKRVFFMGLRDDVPRILTALDIFVLPSITEGLSNSILEAMASGLAVVATEVGGNCELIENGQSGYLIPPRRPEILANMLFKLVSDGKLRARLGEKARRRVVEKFSLKKMVENYQQMYLKGFLRGTSATRIFTSGSIYGAH